MGYLMKNVRKTSCMKEDIAYFNPPRTILPLYISMSGVSYCDGSYHIKRRKSGCTVIEFVVKGSGSVSDGRESVRVGAGSIYILRQNRDHDYFSDADEPWEKMFLNIRGQLAEQILSAYGFENDIVIDGEGTEEDFRRMVEATFDKTKSPSEIFARVSTDFHALVIKLSQKRGEFCPKNEEMEILRRYLSENTHRIVSNSELSKLIHRCEDYCIKKFKEEFGKTPYDYQIDEKIRAAKTILKRSNLTVAEIAERLGYCDQHYFSNQFKKKCGISPSEYRKK
jgi:AraC-like DNA-binding protein